jgi:flagellar hook-length control protein FliK
LLDDTAQTADQSPPPQPENKTASAESSQPSTKSKDCQPAAASNDTAAAKPDPDNAIAEFDANGKPISKDNTSANAKADEAYLDTITTVDKDEKPAEASKTDGVTSAAHTDAIVTIATPEAVATVPTQAQPVAPDLSNVKQPDLPGLAAIVADSAPILKAPDADAKSGVGKQVGAEKKPGDEKQADTDLSLTQTSDDAPVAKPAVQVHPDKPQAAASEGDKQHVADARGESAPNGHFGIDASVSKPGDNAAPSTVPTDSGAVSGAVTASPTHAAPTVTASAITNAQPLPQPIAIPLAGVPIEIASKALAGKNRFDIRLDPPELGRIEVRLDVDHDGNVTSRLTVDRADTLDLLRRDASGLERALQDAGLKTADNGLQFSLRDQSMNQQQSSGGSDVAQIVVSDEKLPSIDTIPQNYGRLAGQGRGLDIRV